jgi:uncharacterized membrane protein
LSNATQATDLPLPVTTADERIGVNGAIAAAVTRGVGSMPALYVTLVIVVGWMIMATWGPLHRVDPYPFPFLLFLNNVVQLVLCSVILVGQRVLGMAADGRAVQTYESAETIFRRVADLQAHLDRHDKALSRGVSLLETTTHPWVERHRVQPPPQAIDQTAGVNGRIAAWLTQRLGSMWAFYASAGIQLAWIVFAEAGVQRFDPYPFAFMTFLSTLAQLVFMIVIMVGQDVLGRAADRRSEQTFLDAEAILYECGRMEARLTAQDRIIDSLADYTNAQVTEHLARAIHIAHLRTAGGDGEAMSSGAYRRLWQHLPEELKEAGRSQARQVGERLAAIGCLMVPASGPTTVLGFTDDEAQLLARLEHERELAERAAWGPEHLGGQYSRARPDLAPWDQLADQVRAQKTDAVRDIPAMLAEVGFQVLRDGAPVRGGLGEADFTTSEWATLQQAMMAAGVLVSLAEGIADADEMHALVRKLREASITHPDRLIRELAGTSAFATGLRTGTGYADYEGPALQAIGSAVAILADKAPGEVAVFRYFLTEIAEVVADANSEGGFFGLGARRRTAREAAAIQAVRQASSQPAI